MTVTLQKLAEECGLAKTTVRNILSSQEGAYASETRQRVLEVAKKFGYFPSRLPRLLKERSSSAVGLLFPNLVDPYTAELLDAFTRALTKLELDVMVGVPHWQTPAEARKVYHSFLSWHLRAFLVMAHSPEIIDPEDLQQIIRSTVMISLNANPWPQCSAVYPDRQMLAKITVEHLVELGHRRIGQLSYSDDINHFKTQTLKGELQARGLVLQSKDIWHSLPPDAPGEEGEQRAMQTFELGKKFARVQDRPTALVAWSESLASRFISGFLAEGGKVPQDLSVITYNQTRSFGMIPVPLTAVGVSIDSFIAATLDLMQQALVAQREERAFCKQVKLEPSLIVRQSTASYSQ